MRWGFMPESNSTDRGQAARALPAQVRAFLVAVTRIYGVILFVVLILMGWLGERTVLTSILIYVPVQTWLLPLLILTPVCFLFHRRLCLAHLGYLLVVIWLFMGFTWSRWLRPPGTTLTCITNNTGQSNHQSLRPFVQAEDPDVIALQDARFSGPYYAKTYPNRFVAGRGEFVMISKYPITKSTLLSSPSWRGRPVAAAFEITVNNETVVIYNIHLPTPRPDFEKLHGLGPIREMLGITAHSRDRRNTQTYSEAMAARVQLARDLTALLQREARPFLVMGDFNMPSWGYNHRLFASAFTDSFARRGRGFGLTFPGYTHNPLSLFGPWLRLDYLFAGKGWMPVYSRVESSRRSQHRAVVARFERIKAS